MLFSEWPQGSINDRHNYEHIKLGWFLATPKSPLSPLQSSWNAVLAVAVQAVDQQCHHPTPAAAAGHVTSDVPPSSCLRATCVAQHRRCWYAWRPRPTWVPGHTFDPHPDAARDPRSVHSFSANMLSPPGHSASQLCQSVASPHSSQNPWSSKIPSLLPLLKDCYEHHAHGWWSDYLATALEVVSASIDQNGLVQCREVKLQPNVRQLRIRQRLELWYIELLWQKSPWLVAVVSTHLKNITSSNSNLSQFSEWKSQKYLKFHHLESLIPAKPNFCAGTWQAFASASMASRVSTPRFFKRKRKYGKSSNGNGTPPFGTSSNGSNGNSSTTKSSGKLFKVPPMGFSSKFAKAEIPQSTSSAIPRILPQSILHIRAGKFCPDHFEPNKHHTSKLHLKQNSSTQKRSKKQGYAILPSRELTYPILGKGKPSSKVPWERIC